MWTPRQPAAAITKPPASNLSLLSCSWCQRMAGTMAEGRWQRENFRGVAVIVDASGDAISLSARNVADLARWEGVSMPSLAAYPALRTLDLNKCRYITRLHESIGQLTNLQRLSLARCERLNSLPDCIGSLENLQEVSLICTVECTHMEVIHAEMKLILVF